MVYYKLPDAFITVCESGGRQIREKGVTNPVKIVFNGIDFGSYSWIPKSHARQKLGFGEQEYIMGIIGRIEFNQKQQNLFLQVIQNKLSKTNRIKIMIVGSGPDEFALKQIVRDGGMSEFVTILPWRDKLVDVYSAIDMLVIPSRYEGLPVVMLEAMLCKLPIAATNVDGMAEILPREWLFDLNDENEVWNTLMRISRSDNEKLLIANYEMVKNRFSIENFQKSFYNEMNSICSQV
jgi:glycosyltransferase involved in cell wall biosynthesis